MSQPENRLLIVEPGDTLVIGHSPRLPAEEADHIKKVLGLRGVLTVPGPVDLATIRTTATDVHVTVTGPRELGDHVETIQRAMRTQRGGR